MRPYGYTDAFSAAARTSAVVRETTTRTVSVGKADPSHIAGEARIGAARMARQKTIADRLTRAIRAEGFTGKALENELATMTTEGYTPELVQHWLQQCTDAVLRATRPSKAQARLAAETLDGARSGVNTSPDRHEPIGALMVAGRKRQANGRGYFSFAVAITQHGCGETRQRLDHDEADDRDRQVASNLFPIGTVVQHVAFGEAIVTEICGAYLHLYCSDGTTRKVTFSAATSGAIDVA